MKDPRAAVARFYDLDRDPLDDLPFYVSRIPSANAAPGDPLVELDTIDGRLLVHIRFRCLLGAIIAPSGQLKSGDIFARVYADGEEIPENYRYCTVDPVTL